jgi:BlaI family penicillinase repressor
LTARPICYIVSHMTELPALSALESEVMQIVWRLEECSAEAIRQSLPARHDLTDSSVRTVLRRLEAKGYVSHQRDGKRFIFQAKAVRGKTAAAAARQIIEKICGGDANSFVLGLVEDDVISPAELKKIQRKLAATGKGNPNGS